MTDNYDKDSIIHEDQRALKLTHYQMAERCMLVEYATIREEMDEPHNVVSEDWLDVLPHIQLDFKANIQYHTLLMT